MPFPTTSHKVRYLKKSARGLGMISVLLGMVIVALLTVTVFNQFTEAQRNARIDEAKGQVATIIGNAQKTYGAARQFGAVTTAMAINGGVIPASMRIGANANNIYDAQIAIAPVALVTAGDALRLTYPVRPSDCQDLVLANLNLVRQVTIGGVAVKPIDAAVNMGALNTQCNVAAAAVAVLFDFGFR
mgnify:CR=1 FL=1